MKIARAVAAGLGVFFVGAFGSWDLNPGNWNEYARVLLGIYIPMAVAAGYFIP